MIYTLTHPNAKCPEKKNSTDACWDLFTPINFTIHHLQILTINIGFKCILPKYCDVVIRPRSKLGKKGIIILGGEIDNSYRDDWGVVICNLGSDPLEFKIGEAIAQFRFIEKVIPDEQFQIVHLETFDLMAQEGKRATGIWSGY